MRLGNIFKREESMRSGLPVKIESNKPRENHIIGAVVWGRKRRKRRGRSSKRNAGAEKEDEKARLTGASRVLLFCGRKSSARSARADERSYL